jgi:hypothetical protein
MAFEDRFSPEARKEAGYIHFKIMGLVQKVIYEGEHKEMDKFDGLLRELETKKSRRCYDAYASQVNNLRQLVVLFLSGHIDDEYLQTYMDSRACPEVSKRKDLSSEFG